MPSFLYNLILQTLYRKQLSSLKGIVQIFRRCKNLFFTHFTQKSGWQHQKFSKQFFNLMKKILLQIWVILTWKKTTYIYCTPLSNTELMIQVSSWLWKSSKEFLTRTLKWFNTWVIQSTIETLHDVLGAAVVFCNKTENWKQKCLKTIVIWQIYLSNSVFCYSNTLITLLEIIYFLKTH